MVCNGLLVCWLDKDLCLLRITVLFPNQEAAGVIGFQTYEQIMPRSQLVRAEVDEQLAETLMILIIQLRTARHGWLLLPSQIRRLRPSWLGSIKE